MNMKKSLGKISLRYFEPKTARSQKEVKQKNVLKDEIEKKPKNLAKIKKSCQGKTKFALDVKFFLWDGSGVEGRSKKDLDNLLKVVFDVLADYMDSNKKYPGLGLMQNDKMIHEVHATKKIVKKRKDEGLDIKILKI